MLNYINVTLCKRLSPREWFIAPLNVMEQAIELIISRKISDYRYDFETEQIVTK